MTKLRRRSWPPSPRFGWNVAEHEIHEAARYLKKLGLVPLTAD